MRVKAPSDAICDFDEAAREAALAAAYAHIATPVRVLLERHATVNDVAARALALPMPGTTLCEQGQLRRDRAAAACAGDRGKPRG